MDKCIFTSHTGFDILKLQGEVKIAVLPTLSPVISDHITDRPQQHIVLDMSGMTAIDISIIKLLANIQKRLESNNKKLFILHPPEKYSEMLKNGSLVHEISDINELESNINEDIYRTYLPYSYDELALRRIQCNCVVCGSKNVIGYLLNQNSYKWTWDNASLFPTCTDATGEPFDYFGALPIVCADCYMVSTDINHFNVIDAEGMVVHHATLTETAKIHLAKAIKKRRNILASCEDAGANHFFLFPRTRVACYYMYLLADASIRTLALNKIDMDPYLVGFLNYIAIRYAEDNLKGVYIDNCRTWLTQSFHEKKIRSHSDRALAYFVLFASALSFEKVKEANAILQDFTAMMNDISYSKNAANNITSPLFWFSQTQKLWQKEIEKKSSWLVKNQ